MPIFSDLTLRNALIQPNGEYAWMKDDICSAIDELVSNQLAILGGEVWLSNGQQVMGVIPQRIGPPVVYHWETKYLEESWHEYRHRCAAAAKNAVIELSVLVENASVIPAGFKVFFNLTWVDEKELK